MPSEDIKVLDFNQYCKFDTPPFVIYTDLKSSLEKIDGCKKNPGKSSMTKVSEHIPSGFSMSAISSKDIKNKHDLYRGKDCMKTFCESLRQHAMKVVNLFKKWNRKQTDSRNYKKMQKIGTFKDK